MTADHDFDGLYDLRDLQDSDAWFSDAASRRLASNDPLSPAVVAMLDRLDRELNSLPPVDRTTVTALIGALSSPGPAHSSGAHLPQWAARHARRNVIVASVAGAMLVAAGGVAAASPGSFLYPVRQVALGAPPTTAPVDLSGVESELNRIEVRIAEAQQLGGITESSRTALTQRMAAIHEVLDHANGDQVATLTARWTRDDLVLITLPRLGGDTPTPSTVDTSTSPDATPTPSLTTSPTPSADDAPGGPVAQPTSGPVTRHSPTPRHSHSPQPTPRTSDPGHHPSSDPTPTASPTESGDGGDPHPTTPPDKTKTPKPSPTAGGTPRGDGQGNTNHNKDNLPA
jgi:hypothetical protein